MLIPCHTIKGGDNVVEVPSSEVTVRLSAYGFIVGPNGKLLMLNTKETGLLWLPGGGVNIDESFERALERETLEETGISIEVVQPLLFFERYFYCEDKGEAWRTIMRFFLARPLSFDLLPQDQWDPNEASDHPHWERIDSIDPARLQPPLTEIFPQVRKMFVQATVSLHEV
jgi:ADP-ribose pyrophosphatase YjhB (NUDIX family)